MSGNRLCKSYVCRNVRLLIRMSCSATLPAQRINTSFFETALSFLQHFLRKICKSGFNLKILLKCQMLQQNAIHFYVSRVNILTKKNLIRSILACTIIYTNSLIGLRYSIVRLKSLCENLPLSMSSKKPTRRSISSRCRIKNISAILRRR